MPGLRALHRLSAPQSRDESLEEVPADEDDAITRIVELVREEMRRTYVSSRPVRRGQHPKSHGCVKARFIVEDVPKDLRHGLFEKPGTYGAWVRFSGSHAALRSDAKRDAQGMTIKVMGVEGEKMLHEERTATTQDFVLVDHGVFFLRDANECADFAKIVTPTYSVRSRLTLQPRVLLFFLRPSFMPGGLRRLWTLWKTIHKKIENPLAVQYWSQTAFALGPYAVKYTVRPCLPPARPAADPQDYDALEKAVAASLRPQDAEFAFDFLVQRQADASTMPVEDPTVPWREQDSPFRKVATIVIKHQTEDIMSQRSRNWSEQLSFTPWHTTWDHRPLGGVNRARRAVYQASSELRHELDGAPHVEPGPY